MLEESTLTQHLLLVNCNLRCTASIWLVIRTNLIRLWGIHICGGWEVPTCAVEDVNDLWESVKEKFEARVPFKKASLNNKARNLVFVDKLHVDYVQTTDARLRRGLPGEQIPLPLWFRRPYACVVLVTCEVSLFLVDFSSNLFFLCLSCSCTTPLFEREIYCNPTSSDRILCEDECTYLYEGFGLSAK